MSSPTTSPDKYRKIKLLLKSLKQPKLLGILIVVGASIAGGALSLYGMNYGPSVGSDSVEYFEAAQNLASGHGLVLIRASGKSVPLSLRPPLYPIALALTSFSGSDLLVAARAINALLVVAFIGVLGISLQLLIKSTLLTSAVVLFVLSSPSIYFNFTSAMSEPIFLTLAVASLASVALYLEGGKSKALLIIGATCAALGLLARFVGLAVVLTGGIALIGFNGRTLRRKMGDAVLFSGIGITPFLLWSLSLLSRGSQPGSYSWPTGSIWQATAPVRIAIVDALWDGFSIGTALPKIEYDPKLGILIAVGFASGLAAVLFARRRRLTLSEAVHQPSLKMTLIFTAFAGIYVLILTSTYLFVSVPKPALISRILFPIPLFLMCGLLCLWYFVGQTSGIDTVAGVVPLSLSLVFATTNIAVVSDYLVDMHTEGSGYSGKRWQGSETIDLLRNLPEDRILISNQTDAIQFFIGRPAFDIPELGREEPVKEFLAFGEGAQTIAETAFRQDGAALVLFSNAQWDFAELYGENAVERMNAFTDGLFLYAELSDGAVYFWEEAVAP